MLVYLLLSCNRKHWEDTYVSDDWRNIRDGPKVIAHPGYNKSPKDKVNCCPKIKNHSSYDHHASSCAYINPTATFLDPTICWSCERFSKNGCML
jgi:hypothetical protein